MQTSNDVPTESNPYITIIAKRLRNLKKKLKKCDEVEAIRVSGKPLLEEQLAVLASRLTVERNIEDFESIKAAMMELWKDEQSKSAAAASSIAASEVVSQPPELEAIPDVPPPQAISEPAPAPVEPQNHPMAIEEIGTRIRHLIRALHVSIKYSPTTGNPLPPAVDFFVQSVLGKTSVQPFTATLEASVRTAGLYLDEELGKTFEVCSGMNYADVQTAVMKLAAELGEEAPTATGKYKNNQRRGRKDKGPKSHQPVVESISEPQEAALAAASSGKVTSTAGAGDAVDGGDSSLTAAELVGKKLRSKKNREKGRSPVDIRESPQPITTTPPAPSVTPTVALASGTSTSVPKAAGSPVEAAPVSEQGKKREPKKKFWKQTTTQPKN